MVPAIITEVWIEYLVQETQREIFAPLLAGGVELYEYYPGLLHTKVMTIDGIWATVGSTNLDNRSMGLNDELNIICYDESVAKRLERDFFEDLALSRKITPEQLGTRGWLGRILGFLALPLHNHL
jgi:cardiolipin synthase